MKYMARACLLRFDLFALFGHLSLGDNAELKFYLVPNASYNNNTTTSQSESHFCGVWEDSDVDNLTFVGISVHREADSKRPTK